MKGSEGSAVAIIPARGGSKRIPQKNVRPFFGKPMIRYSIDVAIRSGLFDRIIVSTDSAEIAQVAKEGGAEVPFTRPASLADDHTVLADVIHHALVWFKENDQKTYKYACCILATAPFLKEEYLVKGYDLIRREHVGSVIPITSFPYPILRAVKIDDRGFLRWFWPEHELTRSNDLPEAYHDVGQFYWLETASFLRQKRLVPPDARPLPMPRHLVQDVDTPEDWQRAEQMYQAFVADKA